jgi:Tfp pilus assembly protein PilN
MKISTNFVSPVQQAVMPVVAALWFAAFCFAAAAWWLVDGATALRQELPQLRQRLERMETGGGAAAAPVQLPPAQELAQTRDRVAKINAAAQTRGAPISALLSELETLLPPEAWLTSVHHRAAEGEVLLVASAASTETLSALLLKLERDPMFEKVMLLREIQPAVNGKASVQFEIRLKVRS